VAVVIDTSTADTFVAVRGLGWVWKPIKVTDAGLQDYHLICRSPRERGARRHDDRTNDLIAAPKAFHEQGVFTWVSLEPTLDIDASLAIVEATHGFVDLYKVGRVNYLPMTKTTDWRDYTLRMLDTLDRVNARHYIKKDLQPFLPHGYPNPLRVPQHHGTRNFGNRNAA
jgi:hypothetical protein